MNIDEIMRDFKRRWEHTYVWVVPPNTTEESLFYVDRIVEDPDRVATMTLSSPEFGKIVLNYGTAHTLKFKYPPVGVFQHGQRAMIFRRTPSRQYKHGICPGNSEFYEPTVEVLRAARRNNELPFDLVQNAFQNVTSKYKEALLMLKSGRYRSVALKDNFSLCLGMGKENNYILFYWDTPVALMDKATGDPVHVMEQVFANVLSKVKAQ